MVPALGFAAASVTGASSILLMAKEAALNAGRTAVEGGAKAAVHAITAAKQMTSAWKVFIFKILGVVLNLVSAH